MSANEKKTLSIDELKAKFAELNKNSMKVNDEIAKLQNALSQAQAASQQLLGAMQSTGDLMIMLVGKEEAQKIVNEIQNPKKEEVKPDGKKD